MQSHKCKEKHRLGQTVLVLCYFCFPRWVKLLIIFHGIFCYSLFLEIILSGRCKALNTTNSGPTAHFYSELAIQNLVLKVKTRQENCVKFLGVPLDSALSWKYHLAALAKKLARTSGLFLKIRHLIPFDTIKLLYHAIFSPFLYYGIVVWGPCCIWMFYEPCFSPTKKFIRAITFNDSFSPSEPLFLKLGLSKLDDILMLQLASFVCACINILAHPVFDNYFNYISNIHDHSTRQETKGDIFVERKNTMQYGIKSFRSDGTKLWQTIPIEIRTSPSISTFRSNFLKLLLPGYSSSYM